MHIDEIEDWEDRMTRASYTQQQRDLVNQCLAKKDKFLDFMQNGDWQVSDTNKKEGYVISLCTSANGVPCLKSAGTMPYSIMQVFACLHDKRYRPIYDDNIEVAEVLSKVAANTYMIYQKTKSMLVVSSRDLVLTHHVAKVQHP